MSDGIRPGIPWARIGAESAAIIASILLAFAIDAWWEQRGEHRRSLAQLSTIRTEFVEVDQRLAELHRELVGLRGSVSEFLQHVGPDAPQQSLDSLESLIDLSFRSSRVELPTGSLQALLASGELSSVADSDLRALLATWPAEVSRLRNQSGLLEDNREEIIRYLHDRIPTLAVAYRTGQMNAYPRSSFTAEPGILQRDMKVEGLFGNRGMMIEDTLQIIDELKVRVATGIELIESELDE
jgi:hypothetical protein